MGISQSKCYVISLARSTECDKLQVDQKDCVSNENVWYKNVFHIKKNVFDIRY